MRRRIYVCGNILRVINLLLTRCGCAKNAVLTKWKGTFFALTNEKHYIPKVLLKQSYQRNHYILAFSINFCPIENGLSGNTVRLKDLGFQKVAKMNHFWHWIWSTRNVKKPRFDRNVDWVFFCDFQTPWNLWLQHSWVSLRRWKIWTINVSVFSPLYEKNLSDEVRQFFMLCAKMRLRLSYYLHMYADWLPFCRWRKNLVLLRHNTLMDQRSFKEKSIN